jgi:hypothetical protein
VDPPPEQVADGKVICLQYFFLDSFEAGVAHGRHPLPSRAEISRLFINYQYINEFYDHRARAAKSASQTHFCNSA